MRLHRGLFRCGDQDLAGFRDHRLAPDHIDLVFLEQKTDAIVQLRRDVSRSFHDGGGIETDLAIDRKSKILGVVEELKNFRRAQQGLGGNAAPVEADAAEMLALDDGRLEAKLRRADRRDIAAGPAADDENIVSVSHGRLLLA